MTVITAQTLRKIGIVSPFFERTKHLPTNTSYGLSSAGYDIRLDQDITILPGEMVLGSSMEKFHMPNDIIGIVHDKSTWVRHGLTVQNTVIEPGWVGFLTLELVYHTRNSILVSHPFFLVKGSPIAQIVFHKLDEPTEQPYGPDDKYQNQGPYPQEAK